MKAADCRAYVRGSKCAGCPRWGACATKCKIDAADIKAAKAGMNKAAQAGKEGIANAAPTCADTSSQCRRLR